ncbi:MAG: glycoside hydrolase family 44 protein [Xanthomonadaceae bacterium]|nr:glycoside hydrolase family 44 protein [Xanthomonadaceae bacterium]
MREIIVLATALWSGAAVAAAIDVSVDLTANVHPFSPLIFGVAYGNGTRNAQMGYTVDRWGGNSTTRYNWQLDVHNTARDYFWENIPDCAVPACVGTPPAGNSADAFIAAARAAGGQPLMTIPTIGWAPRSDSPKNHPYFAGFSVKKYGTQVPLPYTGDAVDPYDTDAGSGDCNPASNASPNCVLYDAGNGRYHLVNNDPQDTSIAVDPGFEAQWIGHMQSVFGTAANGGVKLFTLDNEVMLWNSTHRDVHPQPTTYDEIWNRTIAYASAIKQQEPNALVTGPVTWGYCDLFGSAADNCVDGSDRQNHGGVPFVAWYLQQVCSYQAQNGTRLVDYLDLHWYPQGLNVSLSNADDPATAGRRLRSLKELYDPTWVSESWIADLGDTDANHYDKPDVIPRVRAWIAQYCPGTRLAITEYNWGNDNTVSGAVAQAEALAIFAREGVDLATRWVAPSAGTNAEKGFSIFLNYDGAGGRVQGDSVGATSASSDQIGAYAFHGNARTFVLLTNKDTAAHDVTLSFNASHTAAWQLYGFTGTAALARTGGGNVAGAVLTLTGLPAMSANLLVIPDNDEIFKDGFE